MLRWLRTGWKGIVLLWVIQIVQVFVLSIALHQYVASFVLDVAVVVAMILMIYGGKDA